MLKTMTMACIMGISLKLHQCKEDISIHQQTLPLRLEEVCTINYASMSQNIGSVVTNCW